MLNEGIVTNDTRSLVKSEMLRQIHALGPTNPEQWEQVTFKALTGHDRDEIDWTIEDNHAGYYAWVKSFDELVQELVEDGYVTTKAQTDSDKPLLVPTEMGPPVEWSQMVHPPRPS